ncbi:helix-turn-helix domain-containing protein [Trinickia acidisoli]|uniref:helix-turn-helix domain-containing protein n=1 Tax=Trinickia acidisoli TaxID=2767482 RepID=UPI001A8DECCB|nr:helix-turn-helix transcriptional regulator [Trinickia acidisoli]
MVDKAGARQKIGKRLGQRIAEQRKALGWTQDQLAEQVGVDTETVSRFERGVAVPSLLTLDKLATVLSTSVSSLLSEASPSPSDQALRISAWLDRLPSEDGDFVVAQIQALCDHIHKQRGSTATKSKTKGKSRSK